MDFRYWVRHGWEVGDGLSPGLPPVACPILANIRCISVSVHLLGSTPKVCQIMVYVCGSLPWPVSHWNVGPAPITTL